MTDRPILFSTPMVRAILDGRKTMTRRVLKPQPDTSKVGAPFHPEARSGRAWVFMARDDRPGYSYATADFRVPYAVGDRVWVKEAHKRSDIRVDYQADFPPARHHLFKWRPSIFMPRRLSRITLLVTDVRVQRLQDISEEDAKAEGIRRSPHGNGDQWIDYPEGSSAAGWMDPRHSFQSLWNSIHGPDAWEKNPWVAVITFNPIFKNIDQLDASDAA